MKSHIDTVAGRGRLDKIIRLVQSLQAKQVPIHGIGLQRHWNLNGPSLAEIREAIERYTAKANEVITAVTFWGAADDYTWLDNFPVRGRKNWPYVFNAKHEPKASYGRITD